MLEYLCKQVLRFKYYFYVCLLCFRYMLDLCKNKILRILFVQVLSEGMSGIIYRFFSNRGNQIIVIKYFKIFNCSELVVCYYGSYVILIINLVILGLLVMVYYCV